MSPSNHCLGAAAIAVAAALGAGPALADITVGFSLSLTGGASALGLPTKNSLDLWPREIGGEKLNLIVLDDGGDPTQAVKKLQRLTTENKADIVFASQAVKLVSTHPDAIFVAASGTGAGLPQLALKDRGYTGQVYHTQGPCTQDFIRIAGKTAEAVLMPCPPQVVAAALPDSHASKKVALDYGTRYADKFGKDSPAVFGANAFDGMLMVSQAVPQALKAAKPGTAAFRDALRAALDQRARVLVQVQNGAWKVLQ